MKIVNIFLAATFLLFVTSCKNLKEDKEIVDEDTIDVEVINNNIDSSENVDTLTAKLDTARILVKDTVNSKLETEKIEPIMVENEDGSLKKVSDEEIKNEETKLLKQKKPHVKKFYIIAGSFQNMSNAVNLRTFFKSKGYPSMILYPYRGYNRVATGSYPERTSAERDIKKFRSMNLFYEGEKIEFWLLWR
jgi:cell division protein FtsN